MGHSAAVAGRPTSAVTTPLDNDTDSAQLRATITALEHRNTELERQKQELQQKLALMEAGIAWRVVSRFRHLLLQALPPGSQRQRQFRRLMLGTEAVAHLGPGRALRIAILSPRQLLPALREARVNNLPSTRRYRTWLAEQRIDGAGLDVVRDRIERLQRRPVISLLMPVYNIGADWLEAAVASVKAQVYPHWELCLVDDASPAPHIQPLLRTLASSDPRIKLQSLGANEGISGASNHALAMATGDFVAPLDHDDRLSPEALYEVARRLDSDDTIDLLYTDHDLTGLDGLRRSPLFKPDWSPDLLLSMNYITHFSVYRRTLVEQVGGFRKGYEGSQDYDLLLRASERARSIGHIARPLYSWGTAPSSVASRPGAKPYAHEAGRRALQDALERRGISGTVIDGYGAPFRYRVHRAIAGQPLVSIVIPTRNNARLLERCISSIEARTTYRSFEIIVVDNNSDAPDARAYLQQLRHRVVRFDEPFNFARMNNVAVAAATGEHVLFLNDDTEAIDADWLGALLEHSQRPEVGAVGARLLFPNDTLQHAGVIVGIQGKAGHAFWGFPADHPGYYDFARVIRNYSAVTAACLMMRREVFEALGGFDEAFPIAYNDVDLCLRVRAKDLLVVYTPYATLYHYQSASRGSYDPEKDRPSEELLRARWPALFERGDPYYNPNLTLSGFDFSLKE